jgi:hypothetical protein
MISFRLGTSSVLRSLALVLAGVLAIGCAAPAETAEPDANGEAALESKSEALLGDTGEWEGYEPPDPGFAPDLVVTKISYGSAHHVPDYYAWATVTVANKGNWTTGNNFTVKLQKCTSTTAASCYIWATKELPQLAAGQSTTVSFAVDVCGYSATFSNPLGYSYECVADQNWRAVADSTNKIVESNESNNVCTNWQYY